MNSQMKALHMGELVARVPIIQGGMGVGISLSGLASAVADNGGIGVIASAGIGMAEPDFFKRFTVANDRALRQEIRKARAATSGTLGVNVMVALTNFEEIVRSSIEEGIDIIFSGAGLPMNLPKLRPEGARTKLVPIVSSGRAAAMLCRRWTEKYDYLPDGMVVEGPLAGGHLGFHPDQLFNPAYALENLVPDVIEAVRPYSEKYDREIPVIAAGGIYTGADILKYIRMGASAVQMGTRFVVTDECDASLEFKLAYLNAQREDIIIIKSPVGLPGRVIRNPFVEAMNRGEKEPFKCPYHCIITCDYKHSPYCIALALINAQKGNFKHGFSFAGANAYRTNEIIPVKQLMETLIKEYEAALESA